LAKPDWGSLNWAQRGGGGGVRGRGPLYTFPRHMPGETKPTPAFVWAWVNRPFPGPTKSRTGRENKPGGGAAGALGAGPQGEGGGALGGRAH